MSYVLIIAGVYGVGLLAFLALIVLETELCPLSVRKALEKRRLVPKDER